MPSDISLGSKSHSFDSSSVGCSESLCSYSLFEHCLSERTVIQAEEPIFISFVPLLHHLAQELTKENKKF